MKKYLCCLLLLTSSQVGARDARVMVFGAMPSLSFQLIVPGQPSAAPSGELQNSDPGADPAGEFAGAAPQTVATRRGLPSRVPAWMRDGRPERPAFHFRPLARMPSGACRRLPYQPHAGLSPSGEARRRIYYRDMVGAACEAGIPVELFDSLIVQESRYNPQARSPAGAIGITQLMPGTARDLSVGDAWDVVANLRGGARYLRQQLDTFGSWHLALSAYNAGPASVRRHGGVPPYRETAAYVRAIMASVRLNLRSGEGSYAPVSRRIRQISFTGS